MNLETKSVNHIILRDNMLESIKRAEFYKELRKIVAKKYKEHEDSFFKDPWIAFSFNGKKGYWNNKLEIAIPVQSSYDSLEQKYFDLPRYNFIESDINILFGDKNTCPDEIMHGIMNSKKYDNCHWIGYDGGSFCVETERHANWNDKDSIQIGVVEIDAENFKKTIISEKYSIIGNDIFKKIINILKERSIIEISEDEVDALAEVLSVDIKNIKNEIDKKNANNYVLKQDIAETYIQKLLECDTIRADLEKYDRKCLEDVNSGHWELWSDDKPITKEKEIVVKLEQPLRARNPISDIHENGLIGIDFGTKSTIVSVQDGHEHTTLLRVGIGKLNKAPEAYHYENPTIMELINLDKFLNDYHSRNGRPETSIDDLRVSHAADRDLKSCDNNSFFDSFFYDIKQWCGDDSRRIKIIDQKNKNSERELATFVSLSESDFNPLELYAYYLGLYINNMHEGIYLDYVISFPVTYTLNVKTKILDSFKAGLKKSLPEAIQNNKDVMDKFRVRMGVSEPAAYAITALKEYGFDPETKDDKYLYSIFDFGGGTTDFDFGIWRGSDDRNRKEEDKDYVITHINSEGDKYLGGENLLELLAFEIFKANNEFMRNGKVKDDSSQTSSSGFSFTLPPECVKPSGCETTIRNTPSAKRNTKQLMEVLRPFWEGIIAVADKTKRDKSEKNKETKQEEHTKEYNGYIFRNDEKVTFPISDDGAVTVDLFDNNGQFISGQKLYVKNEKQHISVDLIKILENRIERGVRSFFDSIKLLLRSDVVKESGLNEIQIFLAGNSSKSPILKKLFDKYIEQEDQHIKDSSNNTHFNLYPPLGTAEAIKIQKKKGIEVNNDITAPTGKTGVAYGLISGREGGPILVESEIKAESQSKFKYNIGKARKGKFYMVLDRNEVGYGEWVRFGVASSEDFEIYYTSLPGAVKMPISDSGFYKKRCRISEVNAEADIYIRTISDAPDDLEYCVSIGEPAENANVVRIHLEE